MILSKTKAKEIKTLANKKDRDLSGLFLVEGEKSVADTLGAFELQYLIATSAWLASHSGLTKGIEEEKIMVADKRGLEIISSLKSVPEVVAVYRKPKDIINLKLDPEKLYLLLDEIQDPGNLGTIIRTSDWFGVYDIFASPTTVDVYSPKVVQSSMGSLSRVRIHYVDLKALIDNNPDIKLIGAVLDGKPLREVSKETKGMVVMGNEGRGISEELKKRIEIPVTILPVDPTAHPDSLNVAIATAIVLSHLKS